MFDMLFLSLVATALYKFYQQILHCHPTPIQMHRTEVWILYFLCEDFTMLFNSHCSSAAHRSGSKGQAWFASSSLCDKSVLPTTALKYDIIHQWPSEVVLPPHPEEDWLCLISVWAASIVACLQFQLTYLTPGQQHGIIDVQCASRG